MHVSAALYASLASSVLASHARMSGQCALAVRTNAWIHEIRDADPLTGDEVGPVLNTQAMWDYRIKVDPWQVFGTVELQILGTDIIVEHVWAADVLSMVETQQGVVIKVELGNTPQEDQQFDIDGSGTPSGEAVVLGCEGLEPVANDCKLGVKYKMLNSFEGVVSSKIDVETWQTGAKVSLEFGIPVAISEVWGAQIVDYDIATQGEEGELISNAVFRLLPFNHFAPLDRRSSFGFDATPPFHQIPALSCIPSHPLPPPPPPSPPLAPPAPPPFLVTERADCFLGGRITFILAPSDIPGMLWELNVKMNHWQAGAQLTLDFFGEQLKKHPLRIKSIEPEDTVQEVATTPHSTIVQLKESPVREFNVRAYGMIEGVAKLACCCAPLPSPPPPPPLSPPPPSPPPRSPSPPPSLHSGTSNSEWGRGIQGRVVASSPPPMPPPVSVASKTTQATTMKVIVTTAIFAILFWGGQRLRTTIRKRRDGQLPTIIGKGGIALVPQPQRLTAIFNQPADDLEMPIKSSGSAGTTKLHIEESPSSLTSLKISLEGISTMDELQELVAEVCEEAGLSQLDDLVMTFKRPDGKYATVTRSVTIAMLRQSPALKLAPSDVKNKGCPSKSKTTRKK